MPENDPPHLSGEAPRTALAELARVFDHQPAATALLESAGFPRQHLPPFGAGTPAEFWNTVVRAIQDGRMEGGMDRLLATAADEYPGNPVFRRWRQDRSATENRGHVRPNEAPSEPAGEHQAAPAGARRQSGAEAPRQASPAPGTQWELIVLRCDEVHLVFDQARAALAGLALPEARVELNYAVSGLVGLQVSGLDAGQAADLQARLQSALPAGSVVQLANHGFRDYLYSRLWLQGPDQGRFELLNVPASTRVADVAKAGISEYDDAMWPRDKNGLPRPAVVDHDRADGTSQRLDPDMTLHDSGIADGDTLHVAPQSTAGSVNPIAREQGLVRVRLQIKEFSDRHPGFRAYGNAVQMPTEYRFEFRAAGFAPPLTKGGTPLPVDEHRVILRLPEDFPMKAPQAFWRTPIFHPNIARQNGLVCLGVLADGYRPAMDFGDLCQMLVDMAGYRNYEVREVYDREAREWALTPAGQSAIEARGGLSLTRWAIGLLEQQAPGSSRLLRIRRSN